MEYSPRNSEIAQFEKLYFGCRIPGLSTARVWQTGQVIRGKLTLRYPTFTRDTSGTVKIILGGEGSLKDACLRTMVRISSRFGTK